MMDLNPDRWLEPPEYIPPRHRHWDDTDEDPIEWDRPTAEESAAEAAAYDAFFGEGK
jgi:hypothetical protein